MPDESAVEPDNLVVAWRGLNRAACPPTQRRSPWAFELKLDGYRCIAVKHGKEVTLISRHKKVLNWVLETLGSLRATSFSTESWFAEVRTVRICCVDEVNA